MTGVFTSDPPVEINQVPVAVSTLGDGPSPVFVAALADSTLYGPFELHATFR